MTFYSSIGHRMKPWFCGIGLKVQCKMASDVSVHTLFTVGNNKVSVQLENFFRWNPSGTFRNIPWHHWNNPKKVPGAPSQGFLKFLVFVKNVTKFKNWLSRPHFLANFQLSYHFGKLLTVRSQGFTASKNLGLHQWDMSISKIKNRTP